MIFTLERTDNLLLLLGVAVIHHLEEQPHSLLISNPLCYFLGQVLQHLLLLLSEHASQGES